MNRRAALGTILGIGAFVAPAALAQPAKTWVIGLLDAGERVEWWATFRQQLRDLGYVEGRNVTFELRYAGGKFDQLPRMAEELVRRKVDVIVTSGTVAGTAAKHTTDTIPIVMATGTDQVSLGLAKSLSRPGENVTGNTSLQSDLTAKRFALLREMFPGISRIAVLWHRENSPSAASIRDLLSVADSAKVTIQNLAVKDGGGLTDAFRAATRERAQALMAIQGPLIFIERRRIAELALKHRMPTMNGAAEYVDAGGLVSYAPSYPEFFRRAAVYVDRILKGANPGDLPIEQPTKFELVVNQRTASALGLTVPASILLRADRVIGAL
jgi:putative ABC transport system substrate-binding protein